MDDAPSLGLEDLNGAAAVAWADAQSAATDADADALAAILDRPDNIPFVTRRGRHLFNFWRDAAHPRGLWRRTTLADHLGTAPSWEVMLDLDALATSEHEDWIWGGTAVLPGTHDRAILRFSRSGADHCCCTGDSHVHAEGQRQRPHPRGGNGAACPA